MNDEYSDGLNVKELIVQWDPDAWNDRDEEAYSVVAVIPGCVVFQENSVSSLGDFAHSVGAKHPLLIIGSATTLPDSEEQDHPAPESGGRHDFFFAFHNLDIMRVAISRLQYGVRWWDDIVDNEWNNLPLVLKGEYRENSIYPDYVFDSIGFGSEVYEH